MTQETEEAPLELALVSCQTCDLTFIQSERRQTCPVCGGEAAGPYFQWTLEAGGLRLRDGAGPEAPASPPVAPEAEPPAVEAEAPPPAEEPSPTAIASLGVYGLLPLLIGRFLGGEDATEEDLRETLLALGADRETATIAVGRLTAVRELIVELAEAGVEAEVEVEALAPLAIVDDREPAGEAQEEEPAAPTPEAAPEEPADL
jgi:hypothetical protein